MSAVARKMAPAADAPRILEVPEIVARWNEIKPLLASVGNKGQYWSATPGHAFAHFHDGTWTLWALGEPVRAVCAVGVARENDGSLSLRLEQVAGHAAWSVELEPIAAWARQRGCVRIVMPRARRGWARVFRKRFAVTALYLEASI
jgi:hypothetical protein